MTAALEMPRVQECVVAACAYNQSGDCHAFAITIGSMDHAHCHTFVESPVRGGVDSLIAQVGAASAPTAGTTSSWSATRRRSGSARTTTWPTA